MRLSLKGSRLQADKCRAARESKRRAQRREHECGAGPPALPSQGAGRGGESDSGNAPDAAPAGGSPREAADEDRREAARGRDSAGSGHPSTSADAPSTTGSRARSGAASSKGSKGSAGSAAPDVSS